MMMRDRRSAPSFGDAGGGICILIFLGVQGDFSGIEICFGTEQYGVE